MVYFYSTKCIPPWSIQLFARSFNFFMPARKAVFEMLLSSLVTAHWISSTVWKCRHFMENFNLGEEKVVGMCKIWWVRWLVENSNAPVCKKLLYNCSVLRWRVFVKKESLTGLEFGHSNSSNSLQPIQNTHVHAPSKIRVPFILKLLVRVFFAPLRSVNMYSFTWLLIRREIVDQCGGLVRENGGLSSELVACKHPVWTRLKHYFI